MSPCATCEIDFAQTSPNNLQYTTSLLQDTEDYYRMAPPFIQSERNLLFSSFSVALCFVSEKYLFLVNKETGDNDSEEEDGLVWTGWSWSGKWSSAPQARQTNQPTDQHPEPIQSISSSNECSVLLWRRTNDEESCVGDELFLWSHRYRIYTAQPQTHHSTSMSPPSTRKRVNKEEASRGKSGGVVDECGGWLGWGWI